jgi:DNA-binding SARP family transcriptional activator
MEFRILGPLEVVDRERLLPLGGVKQRSLLAVLLQHANEVVSTDELLGELWGDAPPATALKSIQVYVFHLRKVLGADRLVTRRPGYALSIDPSELDLAAFERLRAEGRVHAALALWRGPPYADLAYESCVQAERARLEELRLAVLEERIDEDLAAGRHAELVGELETLIAAHPLRERLHERLMLALYRSGRQAEALDAYRAARHRLTGELGLEPGAELRRLERAILEQDPALELPDAPRATDALLVVPSALGRLDDLLALAVPLGARLVLACIVPPAEIGAATAALATRSRRLEDARAAAFSSPDPGADLARLAQREACGLLLMDAGPAPLDGVTGAVLEKAECDVGLLVGGAPRDGPVLVPFGAARHDWAALELGARVARATGARLRLIGAISGSNGRDASRLLADASLIVQRRGGVIAEPLLAAPGSKGVLELAAGAGLLVVGLADSWEGGLGRVRTRLAAAPPVPTLFVRRGARHEAPAATPFTWSRTG